MNNTLTVIIPVYNREHLVERTLKCLEAQTALCFDVVLVDNASTDGSEKVLRRWAAEHESEERPVQVLVEKTPGAAAARNAGLKVCRTPWVMFFDSDDTMAPTHIERILRGVGERPGAQILGWDVLHMGRGVKKFRTKNLCWNNLFEGNFATQRWAAETELVRRAGAWDPEVKLWNDIELGSRLLAMNPRIEHLGPEVTVTVYPQEVSISSDNDGNYLQRMEKSLERIEHTLAPGRKIWSEYVRMIAAGNMRRSGHSDSRAAAISLAKEVLGRTPSLRHRLLLRTVYNFRRRGGRGQNHILRHLLK